MKILVLNPGSSSLKYGIFTMPEEAGVSPASGLVENVARGGMAAAAGEAIGKASDVQAVGCRVVHGGSRFVTPVRIDDAVIRELGQLSELAPLHNPAAIDVIEEVRTSLPGIPVVAVFDTAFHQTLPPVAFTYALPAAMNVRRYGFHGISYAYVSSRLRSLNLPGRAVVCHLGNGASVCAMRDGTSIDTSMGMTPMEGLVMGTRAGDLDSGVVLQLIRRGMSEPDLDDLLNHRSGLAGVSGSSSDVRALEAAAAGGDARSELALELFAYRVAKYIGAYAAVLEGLDTLVFTAGIGEHSATMRQKICARLRFLGIVLDPTLNASTAHNERTISSGPAQVWIIPTNEELEIARATAALTTS
jgi:acetate kinase